jgi:hypothetical protein
MFEFGITCKLFPEPAVVVSPKNFPFLLLEVARLPLALLVEIVGS